MKRTAQLPIALTDRDLAIIEMVFSYGGCSIPHLQRKFFKSAGTSCYRRVGKLVDAGYLTAIRLPSQSGQGSGRLLLTIGPQARLVLAELLGCSVTELGRRSRAQAPPVLSHHLAICGVRLSLELAAKTSTVFTAVEWTPEWELARRPLSVTNPKTEEILRVVADGGFDLTLADGSGQSFLFELDRGTMTSPKRMKTRLRAYLLRAKDDPTPVMWVVPDSGRKAALTRWAEEEAKALRADPTIFWITTQNLVSQETVLDAAIWQVVGGPDAVSLAELVSDRPDAQTAAVGGHLTLAGGYS